MTTAKQSSTRRRIRQILFWGLVFLPSLLVFLTLADEVAEREAINWDSSVALQLNAIKWPAFDWIMKAASLIGGAMPMTAFTLVLALWFYLRWRRSRAVFLLAVMVGATLINVTFKAIWQRPRPSLFTPFVLEPGFSFPSGHSTSSVGFAVALIVLAWKTRWRWLAVVFGTFFFVTVGVSRVYLGAHYPSDVIAAWAVTLIWVALVALVWRIWRVGAAARAAPIEIE